MRADVVAVQPMAGTFERSTPAAALRADRLSIINHLGPFLPVGFYYKAFHGKRLFPRWERMFRNLAGLGSVDLSAPRQLTPKRYDFCDVLVIGAGPSGLAAALAAAERGAAVLLVDENQAPGGSGLYARGGDSETAQTTMALIERVRAQPRIRLLTGRLRGRLLRRSLGAAGDARVHDQGACAQHRDRTGRAGSSPRCFAATICPGSCWRVPRSGCCIGTPCRPRNALAVLTANAEGYAAALDALAMEPTSPRCWICAAPEPRARVAAAEELARRGVSLQFGVEPIEASARSGSQLGRFDYTRLAGADGRSDGQRRVRNHLGVDGLWMSVGFAPANALLHQARAQLAWSEELGQFLPEQLPAGLYACGKVNGVFGLAERIADGQDAGTCAAGRLAGAHCARAAAPTPAAAECPTHAYPIYAHPKGKEFVDFDEDLQIRDIENACQEGFDSSELLKRFSTLGMGPSQGKHSHMNALRILARVRGEPLDHLGMTTARPMFYPVPLSHLAGRGFTPERRTPLDDEHAALGAVWMPAGNWRRPEYYAVKGRTRTEAIAEEVAAVRTRVGLIDVGTLGKIESARSRCR